PPAPPAPPAIPPRHRGRLGGHARRTSRNRMRGIATFNWSLAAPSDIVTGFPANSRAVSAAVPSPVRVDVAQRLPHHHSES
ncbi:hypothetical protein, partial [Burkholderia sp. IDO3]|uniref:hypothetical protein n=1 Tax=Burkholderia sp. IDO3 TaxID=1705310 RepID=UPI001C0E9773